MSRIGKKPVAVPEKVKVAVSGQSVNVEGPKGKMHMDVHPRIAVELVGNEVIVKRPSDVKEDKALHGMTRSMIQNLVIGVTNGFEKTLQIEGVGFKAELKGQVLKLALGFSHPIEYAIPAGIKIETPNPTTVKISGMDKQLVGQVAAEVREFYPVEPYKGKGVRYSDERVRRKQGKSVAK